MQGQQVQHGSQQGKLSWAFCQVQKEEEEASNGVDYKGKWNVRVKELKSGLSGLWKFPKGGGAN